MGWKFWRQKAAAPAPAAAPDWPADSYESVKLLATLFVTPNTPPFDDWRDADASLAPGTSEIAETGCKGLMLASWFWQFAGKHGNVAMGMARDAFIEHLVKRYSAEVGEQTDLLLDLMERARRSFEAMPDDKRLLKVNGQTVEMPFHWFLAMFLLTSIPESPFYRSEQLGDADWPVALCLEHATKTSKTRWEPMLAALTAFAPTSFHSWRWSHRIGAFERHLQRRHGNPLFPPGRRDVSASEVYDARIQDEQVLADVRRRIGAVQAELAAAIPGQGTGDLARWREELDEGHERLFAAGGEPELESLWRSLRDHVIECWRAEIAGDVDAVRALDEAEASFRRHLASKTVWSAQVLSDPRPIPTEEVVPSLLCESVDDIRRSVAALGDDTMSEIRPAALRCVMQALAEGHDVPGHRQKLAVLDVPI